MSKQWWGSLRSTHPDMVGPVKKFVFLALRFVHGELGDGVASRAARVWATVDQPDMRGLGTDMT